MAAELLRFAGQFDAQPDHVALELRRKRLAFTGLQLRAPGTRCLRAVPEHGSANGCHLPVVVQQKAGEIAIDDPAGFDAIVEAAKAAIA